MSVSLLVAYFLTEIIEIQGYLQFWKRYPSEIFWRYSQDESTLVPNNSEFLICLSVCQLAYFLTEIRQIQGYLQFCMRYLSEIFGGIPGIIVHLFQIILNFMYVCQLVGLHTSLLKLGQYRDISCFGLNIFQKYFGDVFTLFPNNHKCLVCLSVCQLACFLTEIRQIQGYLLF